MVPVEDRLGSIHRHRRQLLQAGGVDFDVAGQDQLADNLVALSGAVGGLVAIYGRLRAEKRLG